MKKRFEKVNAVVRTTAALLLTFSLGLLGCELEPQPVPVVRVSGVEVVGDSTVALKVGKMGQLSWKVIPENAANKNVVLESSNPEIVTVDGSGVLDALKAGTATVTVKTTDGEFTASWTVNVASNTKTVTFNYGYDGKEPEKKDIVEGEKVQRPVNNPERE